MLVNELVGGCNLEALLMVDRDLFSNMVVPDGVEKGGVIAAIRRAHGLAPLYHPDPVWMKSELYWWSRENLPIWTKLFATTKLDYNPIWNTDVSERTRDTTETTRNSAQQNTAHTDGGAHDQTQHADDRHATETTGNLYHEHTKADGYTTDNSAGQEKTVGHSDGKEHGFSHTQTEGTEHKETQGTLDTDTTGTRNTTHDETMTDTIKGTKNSTTDVEGKISAENEATYQPYDAQHTDYKEQSTTDEERKTKWEENENTHGTVDTDTTETMDARTTSVADTETKLDTTKVTTGQADRIDRAHGTHGDTGSTDGHGHTERQNGERGTAQDTSVNAHHENAHSMSTGNETETVVVTHEWQKGGNIGVTTTQQMIEAERETVLFNIYHVIADSFHRTFCLDVY